MLSREQLRELLSYCPETGLFMWLISTSNRVKAGSTAGSPHNRGYVSIGINGKLYLAHRLVWLYVHGVFPSHQIDHINGIRDDNRLCNLREATAAENGANKGVKSNNTSGFKGVSWNKHAKKWTTQIMVRGEYLCRRYFDTAKEASDMYIALAEKHHGEFYSEEGALCAEAKK